MFVFWFEGGGFVGKEYMRGYNLGYDDGKKVGLLEAYRDVLKKVDGDEKDNTVWREGNQYYDNVLDYCERKIKEFERWERK